MCVEGGGVTQTLIPLLIPACPNRIPVNVPTGFACFPNDVMHSPKLWVKQKYRNLIRYTPMPRGGHFAAMEEPQLMAEDIQEFTKTVEKMIKL